MIHIRKRIRVNARLPDHDGKYRDEMTQELEIEMEDESLMKATEVVGDAINIELMTMFQRIKLLGGADYTQTEDQE